MVLQIFIEFVRMPTAIHFRCFQSHSNLARPSVWRMSVGWSLIQCVKEKDRLTTYKGNNKLRRDVFENETLSSNARQLICYTVCSKKPHKERDAPRMIKPWPLAYGYMQYVQGQFARVWYVRWVCPTMLLRSTTNMFTGFFPKHQQISVNKIILLLYSELQLWINQTEQTSGSFFSQSYCWAAQSNLPGMRSCTMRANSLPASSRQASRNISSPTS